MREQRTVQTIIALLVTLDCAGLLLSKVQNEFANLGHFVCYEIVWWMLAALLLSYVWWAERRPLASIGFRLPPGRDLEHSHRDRGRHVLLAGLAGIYFVLFPALHFKEDPQVTQVMNQLLAKPRWWRFALNHSRGNRGGDPVSRLRYRAAS